MPEHANRLSLAEDQDLLTESPPMPRLSAARPAGGRRPRGRKRSRAWRSLLLLLVVMIAAAGDVAALGMPSSISDYFGRDTASNNSAYLIDTASIAPFRINVRERGTVDSLKSVTLSSKVEGTTTIISIVPEGTQVKEGDLLVELDSSALIETEKQQVIAVTQAEAALTKATESLAIQERQNESDVAAAELALLLAELDLEKWKDGDYPQQVSEQQGLVKVAEEELDRATKVYEFSKRLAQKGYVSKNQLETDRIAMTKAQINLQSAKEVLGVLVDYTNKRTISELSSLYEEAGRARERIERQGTAALAQLEADLQAAKLTLQVEQEKLERARTQIANSKIYAPQAGEVVYAVEDRGRGDQAEVIAEGASIRERKAIIKLPDLSQMKVDARIHESLISRIREGLPARIRIDAVPGKVFTGKVLTVSPVPVDGDWMRPDLKEYACVIGIEYTPGEDARLKPGLTAEVEIIVQQRSDVLQVPFQAIVTAGNTRYIYVLTSKGPERREILTGASNDTHVEILDGVAEGEKVILNARTHFSDELAELAGPTEGGIPGEAAEGKDGESTTDAAAAQDGPAEGPGSSAAGSPRAGGPQAGEGGRAAGGGRPDPAQFFARLDVNKDGSITKDEVQGPFAERFDTLDSNKDGKVDQAEFTTGMKSFQRPGGGAGGPGGGRQGDPPG